MAISDKRAAVALEQHNREIHENLLHWRRKPVLQRIYGEFYNEIALRVDQSLGGLVVELGSGLGNIKQYLPQCITTDIFSNPWIDRVENAYRLNFEDHSVSHLILFDVWHHLEFPGTALREFDRVLLDRGRLIIFEPAMGLLGRVAFGLFHHEPLGLREPIQWEMPSDLVSEVRYYAAQGNASRIFCSPNYRARLLNWCIIEMKRYPALTYLASGGFRGPQLFPDAMFPILRRIDYALAGFPRLASRMLVLLEKSHDYHPAD